jgi:hypothetical protein
MHVAFLLTHVHVSDYAKPLVCVCLCPQARVTWGAAIVYLFSNMILQGVPGALRLSQGAALKPLPPQRRRRKSRRDRSDSQ